MKTIFKPIVFLFSLLTLTTCSKDSDPNQTSTSDNITNPIDENSETDPVVEEIPDVAIFDISSESEANWDFWIVGKEEESFFIKLKEDRPSQIYFIPAVEEEGITILLDDSGLPSRILIGDQILVYDNFSGSNYDVAIIQSDNSVNFIKNIESSIDWESIQSKLNSKQKFDWLEVASLVLKASLCDMENRMPSLSQKTIGPECESFLLSAINFIIDGELIESDFSDLVSYTNLTIGCAKGLLECGIALIEDRDYVYRLRQEYLQGLNDAIELTIVEMESPSSAPTIPSQPWPVVDAKIRGAIVNFAWTSIDSEQEGLTYDLYFGTNPKPTLYESGIDEPTYRITSLESGKRYYWSIRAIDPTGNITYGPIWYFDIVTVNNDEDNDQVPDDEDECPNTPQGSIVDENGCVDENASLDDDKDGVNNAYDECPDTPTGENVYSTGCSLSQKDDDNDGVSNSNDQCGGTLEGEDVNEFGCSESQIDDDNDGINNSLDECPETQPGEDVDAQGCAPYQLDEDGDGVSDNIDICPNTPAGEDVNQDGCAQSQLDDDEDGVANDIDQCPNTESGKDVNTEGCAQYQLDNDQDGISDDIDLCPNTPEGTNVDQNGCYDADKTVINDVVFENYLETHNAAGTSVSFGSRDALGDGIANNGKVIRNKLSEVSSLRLPLIGDKVSNLNGIQDFDNLVSLEVSNHNLTSLDLSGNINLLYLQADNNQIQNLNISNNSLLTNLDIWGNQISNLDISSNPNLLVLNCSNNNLNVLDISNNVMLSELNAGSNQISTIDFINNASLTYVNLSENIITQIDIRGLSNLEDFRCQLNLLTYLDISENNKISKLYTSGSPITCIKVNPNQLENLANFDSSIGNATFSLNCNGTLINIPDSNFEQALVDLGLDDIVDGSVLQSNIRDIEVLDVSNRNISNLGGIRSFESLKELNCSSNSLSYLSIVDLENLEILNFSNNNIIQTTFNSELFKATGLQEIIADSNPLYINGVDLSESIALTKLSLTNTDMESLDVSNNPVLIDFNCANNANLSCIQVSQIQLDNYVNNWLKDSTTSFSLDCSNTADSDSDGVIDSNDQCPNTPIGVIVDAQGCSDSQKDSDNDGVTDDLDQCPNTPNGETVNGQGCGQSQIDDDNDGVSNANDQCPNTPIGVIVDAQGCSDSQKDSDNDGVTDDIDQCPNTPNGETVNGQGCGQSQLDDDNDGVTNDIDQCPNTPPGETVNANGCPVITPTNLLLNGSAESGTSNWVVYGDSGTEVLTSNNNVFFTKDIVDNQSYFVQDVTIGTGNTNKHLLIIGNLWVDNVVAGSITRRPALSGYQMTSNELIQVYMQGQDHSADARVWQVISGIYQIASDVEIIRLFLQQNSQEGDEPDGTKALFDDIELLIFDTYEEAIYYRDNY